MEWKRRAITLLACLLVALARVSSREIAQDIMDSKTVERVKKWCANTGSDSCGKMYVQGSGDDEDYLNHGDNPGKRALLKRLIAYRNRARLFKCSTNTGDDSCGNGYVPGSGNDNDYLNNGDNPGKRALNVHHFRPARCSTNTGDDSCGNGYVPGSGNDDDYLNNGDNPGKRALNVHHLRPARCSTNTGDDSCGNGYVPGSGNDNDYLNNGDNPGKRASAKLLNLQRLRLARCSTNTGDDSCGNGYVPGSGDDNDYLNGDDNPGKRVISKLSGILQHRPIRCSTNTGDDSCGNGYVPGSGNDNDYLNNGDNPGKRASHSFNFPEDGLYRQSGQASSVKYASLKNFCDVFPMSPACRNLK